MFGIIVDVSDLGVSYAPDAGLVVTRRWKQEIKEKGKALIKDKL